MAIAGSLHAESVCRFPVLNDGGIVQKTGETLNPTGSRTYGVISSDKSSAYKVELLRAYLPGTLPWTRFAIETSTAPLKNI